MPAGLTPKILAEIISKHYIPTSERVVRYSIEVGELMAHRFRPRGKYNIFVNDVLPYLQLNQVPKDCIQKIMGELMGKPEKALRLVS